MRTWLTVPSRVCSRDNPLQSCSSISISCSKDRGVGEWVFKVGVWGGLCGDSGVRLRSGSVMVGVVEAWFNEGAIFVVRV